MTDRDAGYREGIEAAKDAVAQLRQSAACNFTDDNCKGQRGQDRVDALYDAYQALCALPLPSTPDDGKAEDSTCYIERSEVRQIILKYGVGPCGDILYEVDRLKIFTRQDFTQPASHASDCAIREAYAQAIRDADDLVGNLWVDLFNKDLVKAAGADFFDEWRERIRALSAHAGDAAKESGGGEPKFGCKRAGGFVDSNCMAMCDCHKTMILTGPPDTHAEVKG